MLHYFSKTEITLWCSSVILVIASFCIFDRESYMTLAASLIGYLTFKRNSYYAIAYAANDAVLILLWILASLEDIRYISVVVCFAAFLVNDGYGFLCWKKREIRQAEAEQAKGI